MHDAESFPFSAWFETADVVVSGEGSFDNQSFLGKAPFCVAQLAHSRGKKCVLICGRMSVEPSALTREEREVFENTVFIDLSKKYGKEQSMTNTDACIQKAIKEIEHLFQ